MGDANLCTKKWNDPSFIYKRISDELNETLTQCGLVVNEMGNTYLADRLSPGGDIIVSAIDHV